MRRQGWSLNTGVFGILHQWHNVLTGVKEWTRECLWFNFVLHTFPVIWWKKSVLRVYIICASLLQYRFPSLFYVLLWIWNSKKNHTLQVNRPSIKCKSPPTRGYQTTIKMQLTETRQVWGQNDPSGMRWNIYLHGLAHPGEMHLE